MSPLQKLIDAVERGALDEMAEHLVTILQNQSEGGNGGSEDAEIEELRNQVTVLTGRVDANETALSGKADASALATKADVADLDDLATKTEVTSGLATKADASALDDLATKAEVTTGLATKADTSALATKADKTEITPLATKAEVTSGLATKADQTALEALDARVVTLETAG